jgi:hypothetical protein
MKSILRIVLTTLAGAMLAPAAVLVLFFTLGVVQRFCWGPGENDSCLVLPLAVLYLVFFVSWIPGALIGFVAGVICSLGRRQPAQ